MDHEIKKLSKILEEMNPYEEIFPDTKLIADDGTADRLYRKRIWNQSS